MCNLKLLHARRPRLADCVAHVSGYPLTWWVYTCAAGWGVIGHPLGSEWLTSLSQSNPELVPHTLLSQTALETLIHHLPLRPSDVTDYQLLTVLHM
jgi:hypothetical protein